MIELGFLKRYDSIKKLIEFGANGYFPLFDNNIYTQTLSFRKMTKTDRLKAKGLLKKMSHHDSLEKQKVLFSTFQDKEKEIVAFALMEMIEGKILDGNPQIQ